MELAKSKILGIFRNPLNMQILISLVTDFAPFKSFSIFSAIKIIADLCQSFSIVLRRAFFIWTCFSDFEPSLFSLKVYLCTSKETHKNQAKKKRSTDKILLQPTTYRLIDTGADDWNLLAPHSSPYLPSRDQIWKAIHLIEIMGQDRSSTIKTLSMNVVTQNIETSFRYDKTCVICGSGLVFSVDPIHISLSSLIQYYLNKLYLYGIAVLIRLSCIIN